MIHAWRIVKTKYKNAAFNGEGAAFASGRWHEIKTPMVYCSDTLALAALELFVHLQEESKLINFVSFEIHIPSDLIIKIEEITTLPKKWRQQPPGDATKKIGSLWHNSLKSTVLSVPSTIIPNNRNYLLNPNHINFKKIKINSPIPFSFDSRMWK